MRGFIVDVANTLDEMLGAVLVHGVGGAALAIAAHVVVDLLGR